MLVYTIDEMLTFSIKSTLIDELFLKKATHRCKNKTKILISSILHTYIFLSFNSVGGILQKRDPYFFAK
ncbi:hypothetical protein ZORO111903_05200 [Zobellia roscoffensis]